MYKHLLILSCMIGVGCQTAPTRVYEEHQYGSDAVYQKASKQEVRVTDETVILDTRSALDFNSARIPRSVAMSWTEFASRGKTTDGLLVKDNEFMARRLARVGITPDSKVLIVGYGQRGQGDDGRLAWTLYYLGVSNVQFTDVPSLRNVKLVPDDTSIPTQPAQPWTPSPRESVLATKKEVLAIATGEKIRKGEKAFLIDVRSQNEYFSKKSAGGDYHTPNIETIHIPWTEFFTTGNRVNFAIKAQLSGIGADEKTRVVLISNHGVRSAAVTMALLAMGYKNAANYAGGYNELLGKSK